MIVMAYSKISMLSLSLPADHRTSSLTEVVGVSQNILMTFFFGGGGVKEKKIINQEQD